MVTIYTERGPAGEVLADHEIRPFHFWRLTSVALGSALLLSLIGAYNLNSDVKNMKSFQLPYVEQRASMLPQAQPRFY